MTFNHQTITFITKPSIISQFNSQNRKLGSHKWILLIHIHLLQAIAFLSFQITQKGKKIFIHFVDEYFFFHFRWPLWCYWFWPGRRSHRIRRCHTDFVYYFKLPSKKPEHNKDKRSTFGGHRKRWMASWYCNVSTLLFCCNQSRSTTTRLTFTGPCNFVICNYFVTSVSFLIFFKEMISHWKFHFYLVWVERSFENLKSWTFSSPWHFLFTEFTCTWTY